LFKRNESEKGIALLTVMVIMTVVVVTGSLLLKMSSSESRIIDNYGDNSRAYYVAEAGADLAIKQWKSYIGSLALVDGDGQPTTVKADIGYFLSNYLNGSTISVLEDKIRAGYNLGSGSSMVSISYVSDPLSGELDKILPGTSDPKPMLTITVTGNYDSGQFEQKVQLWYYWNGTIGSYKGYGTATVNSAPAIPGGGGGGGGGTPPEYNPPTTASGWTVLTGGGTEGQWNFDPVTGTISRTPESGHDFLYNNDIIRVPFSLNMDMSFFNLHHDSDKYLGSFAGMGLGYDPWGIPHYAVYLTILDFGLGPQVTVAIFRDFSLVTFGMFNQPMNGESSRYSIQVTAKTGEFKMIVSDGTGQQISHTSTTTLRDGRMLLIDGTNSHADPKFTFP